MSRAKVARGAMSLKTKALIRRSLGTASARSPASDGRPRRGAAVVAREFSTRWRSRTSPARNDDHRVGPPTREPENRNPGRRVRSAVRRRRLLSAGRTRRGFQRSALGTEEPIGWSAWVAPTRSQQPRSRTPGRRPSPVARRPSPVAVAVPDHPRRYGSRDGDAVPRAGGWQSAPRAGRTARRRRSKTASRGCRRLKGQQLGGRLGVNSCVTMPAPGTMRYSVLPSTARSVAA
jgi:hypothetical protein